MITIYDAMMGSGKTTLIIDKIKQAPQTQKFMFITPMLTECHRIAGTTYKEDDPYKRPIILESDEDSVMYETIEGSPLLSKSFKHPYFSSYGGKAESLPTLINNRQNIVSTHQLFLNLTPTVLKHAKDYILVIDEMLAVYDIYSNFKKEEVETMLKNKWISLDPDDGITLRFHRENYAIGADKDYDPTENTYYENFATLCDLGQLVWINGKVIVWELAVDTIKAFKEVWIATYLFEDSIMSTYLKAHKIEYKTEKFGNKPSDIKHLINIYEDTPKSKLNSIGKNLYDLSATASKKTEVKDAMASGLDNFIRNKVKAKKTDIIWTCYKEAKSRVQGTRYKDQWLPLNTKATNDYGDRHTIIYLCNVFPNQDLTEASRARGFEVDKDKHALSEMVQFIWRSAIRNGKEINLYLPSSRMRTLLKDWLEDKYE